MATPEVSFWRLPRVEEETGLSGTTIYRLASEGTFPKPIKIAERASAWVVEEVRAWMAGRVERARGREKRA